MAQVRIPPTVPRDGEAKPCPQCSGSLIFLAHYPVLTVGTALIRTGVERANRLRFYRAWICRTAGCEYRELLEESDAPTLARRA